MNERFDNFIAGCWTAGVDYRPNINPSRTSDIIGEYARADADQVRVALQAAAEAFPQWSQSSIQKRHDALDFVGSELLSRQQAIGTLLAREEGKTLREGIAEVVRAGQIFKFFAAEALRMRGERLESVRPGVHVEVTREPVGVVAAICPWNFPIAIPAWKIAPALAYGNCVVFKPAELVPGCAWTLAEILSRAGLPAGVFNLVNGSGATVGQTLIESELVDALSFTGSSVIGRRILTTARNKPLKLQLEMGGKNALVVLDDSDLDVAVDCAIQGAFFSAGQRCTASSRLIVTQGVHDMFVAGMEERMRALVVGDALDERTHIGPLASEAQLDTVRHYRDLAAAECGNVIDSGQLSVDLSAGYFFRPTLVTNTTAAMTVNCEEIFGPIASVMCARDYDEALQLTNDTPFGLSAGICTRSLRYAEHFKRHAQVGMVMVNVPTAGVDYHVPFGGRKSSSYGPREQGRHAQEFYTTVKTAYVRPL